MVAALSNSPLLKCKRVYKIKRDEKSEAVKYKARLVAEGFTQEHGVNFFETFAPVAKIQTIRLTLFIALQPGCFIPQFYNSSIFSLFRIMPMRVLILLPLLCYSMLLSAQTYGDYIGGGHDQNITVTTSSDFQPPGWEDEFD